MARGFILTFHSHRITGNTYTTNDHVALDETLALLRDMRIPVVRLLDVVHPPLKQSFSSLPARFVCITFDDGTDFDWYDRELGDHGRQRSMYAILRKHSTRLAGSWWLRRACATSFVIASRDARRDISRDAFGNAELMSDSWWKRAQASGLLDIGTHSWNHVHPAVQSMQGRPDLVEQFHRLCRQDDAQLQVSEAFRLIRSVAQGDSGKLFAYPYGQVSEYLAKEYLPAQNEIVAAVSAEPKPFGEDSDRWRLPRYVCGGDWKSKEDLVSILRGG